MISKGGHDRGDDHHVTAAVPDAAEAADEDPEFWDLLSDD